MRWSWLAVVTLAACGPDDLDGDGWAGDDDCDDRDPAVFVGAPEACNGGDDDCDGFVDEGVAQVAWWDRDGDGFGDPAYSSRVCALPADAATQAGDCDDTDAQVAPGAPEACNTRDDDCDGVIDEDAGGSWYTDADGDGHGAGAAVPGGCVPDPGQSALGDDCDDASRAAYPGAIEVCDGIDNDCDQQVDDGAPVGLVWRDGDGDGYGDPAEPLAGCTTDPGVAPNPLDCDDGDPTTSPDTVELQGDGLDDDCDGYVDEYGVPLPYPTVEDALATAPDGAVVQFDAGVFVTTVDLTGRQLTLAGEGCDRTTLFADGQGTTLTMDGGAVAGLTLAGGTGTDEGGTTAGGGLWVAGPVTASEVCVRGNTATGSGGGIVVAAGTLTLTDSVVDSNYAEDFGGGAQVRLGATLVAERVRWTGNTVSGGDGGALAIQGGAAEVHNSWFAGNVAADDGGAAFVGTATDASTTPEQYLRGSAWFDQCTFHANEVLEATADGSRGEAVYTWGGDATFTGSGFTGHHSPGEVIEDHRIGDLTLGNAQDPTFTWSSLGFFDNADYDYDFMWLYDALHAAPAYVRVDAGLAPADWDLRLQPGSAWIDAGPPDALDPDGSRADLGATGGPGADAAASDSYAADWDGDGLRDGWELANGHNPYWIDDGVDLDGDGLDGAAEADASCDAEVDDTDGDGIGDGDEVAGGTNPTSPADHRPVADAGHDRWALRGASVAVDGTGSYDPNRDPIDWTWVLAVPGGSALTQVDDPHAPIATFTPDVGGTYVLTLTVRDAQAADTHTIRVEVAAGAVVPDDAPTVQAAIDAASDGDVIAIRPGIYLERVDLGGRDLTLVGLGDDPADTVLDAQGGGSVVTAANFEDFTLAQLTLRNGDAPSGGGLYAANGVGVLQDLIVEDCHAADFGGALSLSTGTFTAERVVLRRSSARYGGGFSSYNSDLSLLQCTVAENVAVGVGAAGGGGWFQNTLNSVNHFLDVDNATFQSNTAPLGSGIHFSANLLTRARVSQSLFVGHQGATSTLYANHGTVQVVGTAFVDDESTVALIDGLDALDLVAIDDGRWGAGPADVDLGSISTWPAVFDLRDPAWVRYSANGVADDVFGPGFGSAWTDAGFSLVVDLDGSRADLGPTGGPLAARSARRFDRDDDADGLSDGWEVAFGLDPLVDDASADPDGDGASNADEFAAGTDPQSP
jgi:hypothetical protein